MLTGSGSDFQALRKGFGVRRQGVVPPHKGCFRTAPEQRAVQIESDLGLLPVHQRLGVGNGGAKGGADGLVPQTDPQNGDLMPQGGHHLHGDSRVLRPPRAGGEDDPFRLMRPNFFCGLLIIADDPDIRLEFPNKLVQIVGKTVIVVDQQDHSSASCASSSALRDARALFIHSSNSCSGTESATIPAPLLTNTLPFF